MSSREKIFRDKHTDNVPIIIYNVPKVISFYFIIILVILPSIYTFISLTIFIVL